MAGTWNDPISTWNDAVTTWNDAGLVAGPHFPVIVADTSTVTKLGLSVTRRFALTVADTSNVLALGLSVGRHFPIIVADTSTVAIGFHIAGILHFPLIVADTSTVTIGFHVIVYPHFPVIVADTSTVIALGFEVITYLNFELTIADRSFVWLSFHQPAAPPPPTLPLLWGATAGWVAQPYSIWTYTVSRPMESPGNATPFRAYRYDGTLPYGYQQVNELGLFDNPLDAQNACQVDFEALSAPVIEPPPDAAAVMVETVSLFDAAPPPPALLWASTGGFVANPYSIWVYTVSRPMVSPGNTTPFRAYKYDGTLPYGYQEVVELGLFDNPLDAQNACQADYDAVSVPVLAPPDDSQLVGAR